MTEPSYRKKLVFEAAMIVFSILLAFWIDAWWDNRKMLSMENEMLESLYVEALNNQQEFKIRLGELEKSYLKMDQFMKLEADNLEGISYDSLLHFFQALVIPPTVDPEMAAASLFLNSNQVFSRHGNEIRKIISAWIRNMEDAEEEKESFRQASYRMQDKMATYASDMRTRGFVVGFFRFMAERGPEFLAELLNDKEFVAAAFSKASRQQLYYYEITEAQRTLDSLVMVLNQSKL